MLGSIKRFFKREPYLDDYGPYWVRALNERIYTIENWDQLTEEERNNFIKAKNKLCAITGIIYHEVVLELDGDKTDQELIDNMYCDRMCEQLSSDDLQYILWGHDAKIVMRANKTLESIKQELTHRAMIGYK